MIPDNPERYERLRRDCHKRVCMQLARVQELQADPFYQDYFGGPSGLVGQAVDALLMARDTLERATLQMDLAMPSDPAESEHRRSRA